MKRSERLDDEDAEESSTSSVDSSIITHHATSSGSLEFLILGDWGKASAQSQSTARSASAAPAIKIPTSYFTSANRELSLKVDSSLRLSRRAENHLDSTNATAPMTMIATKSLKTREIDMASPSIQSRTATAAEAGTANDISYQVEVATAMSSYSSKSRVPPSFVLSLGDNFYTKGVSSTSDSLWDSLWTQVYLQYDSLRVPWYPVLGNHDYGYGSSGVQAQIQRTSMHDGDDFWKMPATNYTVTFYLPNGAGEVVVVFIDTITLAPSENECCNEKG